MKIRRFQPVDREGVWRVHHVALEGAGAHAGNGPWDDDLHDIAKHYLDSGGEFLVGIIDDEIVAMGALKPHPDRAGEIKRMRVHPKYQRRGLGQAILDALHARAGRLDLRKLILDTTATQKAAQAFYVKNGYSKVRDEFDGGFTVIHYERVFDRDLEFVV
jgi:ribosomal protein S18 acetylase RimI-like enzyme